MTEPVHGAVRGSASVVHLPEPRRLVRWLAVIIAVLVAMSLAMDVIRFIVFEGRGISRGGTFMNLWDLDTEDTVPTWFSTLLLAGIGALLLAWRRELGASGRAGWAWTFLGAVFLALSFDEMASLHERLGGVVGSALSIDSGPLLYAWVIPAAVALVAFVVVLMPFLRSLHRVTLTRFVVAGAVFVGGALGLELVGGALTSSVGTEATVSWAVTALEETLEMAGALLFLRGIMLHRELVLTEAEGREPQPASI